MGDVILTTPEIKRRFYKMYPLMGGMMAERPLRPPDRIRYGPSEVVGERDYEVVDVPGVFFFAPPRTLPIRTETEMDWKRKRIEEWDEPEGLIASYTWVPTEAELWQKGGNGLVAAARSDSTERGE
jgi:hypothetical protein